jgi:hypothetical protein
MMINRTDIPETDRKCGMIEKLLQDIMADPPMDVGSGIET